MNVGASQYLVLGGVLFAIGLFGVVSRRSTIASLASLSILLSAPLVGAAGVAESGSAAPPHTGGALGLFIVVTLCSELLVGGAVAALVWRRAETADLDELTELDP